MVRVLKGVRGLSALERETSDIRCVLFVWGCVLSGPFVLHRRKLQNHQLPPNDGIDRNPDFPCNVRESEPIQGANLLTGGVTATDCRAEGTATC